MDDRKGTEHRHTDIGGDGEGDNGRSVSGDIRLVGDLLLDDTLRHLRAIPEENLHAYLDNWIAEREKRHANK